MNTLDLVAGGILARLMRWMALFCLRPNIDRITPNLWIGGTNNPKLILLEGFNAVLDLRTKVDTKYKRFLEDHGITYVNVEIPDDYGAPPEVLSKIVDWLIDRVQSQEKILVHCNLGRGRATLAIGAYLVSRGDEPEEAIKRIQRARQVSFLNDRQKEALQKYFEAGLYYC